MPILGMAQFSQTYYGIAPSAKIIALRALDSQGLSTVSTVVAAIQYAVANKTKDNIRVINLSLGHPVSDHYTKIRSVKRARPLGKPGSWSSAPLATTDAFLSRRRWALSTKAGARPTAQSSPPATTPM